MKNLSKDFKVLTDIPKELQYYHLPSGYYVVINRHYTATVRSVYDLKDYINNNVEQIDLDVFGQIKNEDSEASEAFVGVLNRILAEVMGYKTFNCEFKHQFIECTSDLETISVRTKGGKCITLSVMEKYAQCVDIKLHDKDKFKIIGFDGGQTPVPHTDVTLTTILLNK